MSWRNIEPNAYAVLNLLSEAESIIVLDTETTGLAKNAKIIQFSAIRYKINADFSLEQIDFFDTYINPDEKLKAKITEITGISQDMIEKCPKILSQRILWLILVRQVSMPHITRHLILTKSMQCLRELESNSVYQHLK